mmetsp:Transcript_11213/g.29890  ORF Transcript_11213/g.29890 Transcript_11213/m.29890 type:complete len:204 (+) Transcript_11213:357-968(+)
MVPLADRQVHQIHAFGHALQLDAADDESLDVDAPGATGGEDVEELRYICGVDLETRAKRHHLLVAQVALELRVRNVARPVVVHLCEEPLDLGNVLVAAAELVVDDQLLVTAGVLEHGLDEETRDSVGHDEKEKCDVHEEEAVALPTDVAQGIGIHMPVLAAGARVVQSCHSLRKRAPVIHEVVEHKCLDAVDVLCQKVTNELQ